MPPPVTPPLKRPTPLKRDSSHLDTDDEAGLSTTTKKLRVTFDPKVDVRILDHGDKGYDLVKEEVGQAVERHLQDSKDDERYDQLVQLLGRDSSSGEAPSPRLLRKYLVAIDTRINRLGRCGKLVDAVLGLQWVGRDDAFVETYTKVMCDLATAHGKYVSNMLDKLVSHFVKLPASLGRLPEETPVSRTKMFSRVHMLVRTLLRIVPSASNALIRAIKLSFPTDLETTRSYLQFQKHAIRIAEEIPELKSEILALVVQKLVAIDVQVQQDMEDMEDEEKLLQRPSSKDGNGDESDDSDYSFSESEETTTVEEQRLRELRLKVAKMDGTLDLLFEYYTPLIQSDTNSTYRELLAHFSNFISPNRTRHAQFLVFHFSQTSSAQTTAFVKQCLDLVTNQQNPSVQRVTACAYLASYIARGAHIPTTTVQFAFSSLCSYLNELRKSHEPSCRGPDRKKYAVYYAVAQALFYIFCFRWRDLVTGSSSPDDDLSDSSEENALAEGHDLLWMPSIQETLRLNTSHSRLNPLKVCSPAIVAQFAKIAHHLRFLYVYSLIESNKRLRLANTTSSSYGASGRAEIGIGRRETATDRKVGEAHLQMEAYFPFDPYHLPVSKRWVEGDYNEWKTPRGMEKEHDGQDDEGSGSESESDDSDDSLGSPK